MKNFIHREFDLDLDDAIQIRLDRQAHVRMLDAPNFERYCCGQPHTFSGGLATASPVLLRPPRPGHWHVVVDLGGFAGTVSALIHVV